MKTNYEKILEFHEKFNCSIGKPGIPVWEDSLLRVRLMAEELAEVIEAIQTKDYPQIAKELADLLYVVYGTAATFGIPIDKVYREVHYSNMTKTFSKDDGGKVQKGEDYCPPNIEKILTNKWWRGI